MKIIINEILEKHLKNEYYMCGQLHNQIKDAMEEYAQYKVNELNKSDVIKSVCEHKWMHDILGGQGKSECIKCGITA